MKCTENSIIFRFYLEFEGLRPNDEIIHNKLVKNQSKNYFNLGNTVPKDSKSNIIK